MCDLFNGLVSPVLSYRWDIWDFDKTPAIEKTRTSFCKTILGVKTITLDEIVCGELGRMIVALNRHIGIVKYKTNDSRIKSVYTSMFLDHLV